MARNYRSLSALEIVAILDAVGKGKPKKDIAEEFEISTSTIGTYAKKFSGKSIEEIEGDIRLWDKYKKIFLSLFFEKYDLSEKRPVDLPFTSADLANVKSKLGLQGGNPYDPKYYTKGRGALPDEVQATAPKGQEWRIKSTGKGQYIFKLYKRGEGVFEVDSAAFVAKIPDSLPSMVERYARDDEQALLARIRYNKLIDIFLGVSTYSLQSHWKTSIKGTPVEVDEMYVGLDAEGLHYVVPVEAKGRARSEKLTADQILSNYSAARDQFPGIRVIPVAAKLITYFQIAMMEFQVDLDTDTVEKVREHHYILAQNPAPSRAKTSRPILTDDEILARENEATRSGSVR